MKARVSGSPTLLRCSGTWIFKPTLIRHQPGDRLDGPNPTISDPAIYIVRCNEGRRISILAKPPTPGTPRGDLGDFHRNLRHKSSNHGYPSASKNDPPHHAPIKHLLVGGDTVPFDAQRPLTQRDHAEHHPA